MVGLGLTSLFLSILIIILTYFYQKKCLNYWKKRGIPQAKHPLPFFGHVLSVLCFKKTIGTLFKEIYNEDKDLKYIGLYLLNQPALLIKDVHIIENILVKDFGYFVNRPTPKPNPKSEIDFGISQLSDNLWRGLRYKMTPAFSSGKLKLMYENMKPCAQNAISYIESVRNGEVDLKDVSTRYSMDVIGSCIFGIDFSKDSDSTSKFRIMGKKIIGQNSKLFYLVQLIFIMLPRLAEKLGYMFTPGDVGEYFAAIIKDMFNIRQESKQKRNDFVDFLLQIKEQRTITVHSKDPEDQYLEIENVSASESFAITDSMLISQAYNFFLAGFDGLSTPVVCILHQLAKYKHYQQRIRDEIKAQVAKHGSLTYDALKYSTFLDCCINEGLRIYPPAPFIMRKASKDYEIEDGVWIEAGTAVVISCHALQLDPAYHPNPHVFNPERTSGQRSAIVTDFTNFPYGAGPRICLGMRMAQLIMKLFLASVILNYDINLSPKSAGEIKLKKTTVLTGIEETLYFIVKKL